MKSMRIALTVLLFGCALLLVFLAPAHPGLAQAILAQQGNCTSPVGSDFCEKEGTNPCTAVPGQCFDYFRWFTNVLPCAQIPNNTVASAASLNTNGEDWYSCKAPSIPGSTCTNTETTCGTIDTYAGVQCQVATYCGKVNMEACYGRSAVTCQPTPP